MKNACLKFLVQMMVTTSSNFLLLSLVEASLRRSPQPLGAAAAAMRRGPNLPPIAPVSASACVDPFNQMTPLQTPTEILRRVPRRGSLTVPDIQSCKAIATAAGVPVADDSALKVQTEVHFLQKLMSPQGLRAGIIQDRYSERARFSLTDFISSHDLSDLHTLVDYLDEEAGLGDLMVCNQGQLALYISCNNHKHSEGRFFAILDHDLPFGNMTVLGQRVFEQLLKGENKHPVLFREDMNLSKMDPSIRQRLGVDTEDAKRKHSFFTVRDADKNEIMTFLMGQKSGNQVFFPGPSTMDSYVHPSVSREVSTQGLDLKNFFNSIDFDEIVVNEAMARSYLEHIRDDMRFVREMIEFDVHRRTSPHTLQFKDPRYAKSAHPPLAAAAPHTHRPDLIPLKDFDEAFFQKALDAQKLCLPNLNGVSESPFKDFMARCLNEDLGHLSAHEQIECSKVLSLNIYTGQCYSPMNAILRGRMVPMGDLSHSVHWTWRWVKADAAGRAIKNTRGEYISAGISDLHKVRVWDKEVAINPSKMPDILLHTFFASYALHNNPQIGPALTMQNEHKFTIRGDNFGPGYERHLAVQRADLACSEHSGSVSGKSSCPYKEIPHHHIGNQSTLGFISSSHVPQREYIKDKAYLVEHAESCNSFNIEKISQFPHERETLTAHGNAWVPHCQIHYLNPEGKISVLQDVQCRKKILPKITKDAIGRKATPPRGAGSGLGAGAVPLPSVPSAAPAPVRLTPARGGSFARGRAKSPAAGRVRVRAPSILPSMVQPTPRLTPRAAPSTGPRGAGRDDIARRYFHTRHSRAVGY